MHGTTRTLLLRRGPRLPRTCKTPGAPDLFPPTIAFDGTQRAGRVLGCANPSGAILADARVVRLLGEAPSTCGSASPGGQPPLYSKKPFLLATPSFPLQCRPPDNVQAVFREEERCARVGLRYFLADLFYGEDTVEFLCNCCADHLIIPSRRRSCILRRSNTASSWHWRNRINSCLVPTGDTKSNGPAAAS